MSASSYGFKWPRKGGFKALFKELRGRGLDVERLVSEYFRSQSRLYEIMGLELLQLEDGYARASFAYKPDVLRMGGMVHGGIIMTAIDTTAGIAVMTVNEGVDQYTVELKVNFLEPIKEAPFTCEGRVVRKGRRLIVAQGEARDPSGRLCAMGVGTWYVVHAEEG